MSLKAKIEAVLFLTAKPIKAQAMARIVNADVDLVRQALLELVHDYEERQGGLEIADEDGYSFQVKDEYASLMDEFLPVEMSAALIRTLSAIAIKQPISQSEIIRVRGAGAYEHIKELVNRELVAKKDEQGGRSPILSTTKKFQEYFRLTKEGKELRNFLKKAVRKTDEAATAAAAANGQLAIPNVVNNPEADKQLNNEIFLETQDMADAAAAAAAEAAGEQAEPVDGAVAESAETNEAAAEITEQAQAVAKTTSLEIDVSPAAQDDEGEPAATVTLSKLAAAANEVKDPQPIIIDESPVAQSAQDEASDVEKQQQDGAAAANGTTSRSTVQPHKVKDGPPIGTNSKKKKAPTSRLSDLLEKQRELEIALEMAKGENAQQKKIDFSLPPATKPSDTLPS